MSRRSLWSGLLCCLLLGLGGCLDLYFPQSLLSDASNADASVHDFTAPSDGKLPSDTAPSDGKPPPDAAPSDSKPPPDAAPPDSKPPPDAASPDSKPPPDTVPPDTKPPPDGASCVVEKFTNGTGVVTPKSGTWAVNAGALRQSKTGAGNYAVISGVTNKNYMVEASITVHKVFAVSGWVEGAALGVRFQGGTATTPRQYLCGAYPGTNGLAVVHCSGGNPTSTCKVQKSTGPQVKLGQKYLVRATVVGNLLTCELPQSGAKTTFTMGLTSGGPTLITQYADASYDDVRVCPLAP